jgi:hypothetical protein
MRPRLIPLLPEDAAEYAKNTAKDAYSERRSEKNTGKDAGPRTEGCSACRSKGGLEGVYGDAMAGNEETPKRRGRAAVKMLTFIDFVSTRST